MMLDSEWLDDKGSSAIMKSLRNGRVFSAYEIAASHRKTKVLEHLVSVAELMQLILNNIYAGIVCCDQDCTIVFMNNVFGEILGVDPGKAVGTKLTEYFPDSRLPKVMEQGEPELGDICKFKSHREFVVNRIPIRIGGTVVGAILESVYSNYQEVKDLIHKLENLEKRVSFCRLGFAARFTFDDILGRSEAILVTKRIAEKYAKADAPILIQGATGTGKELFAHAIHNSSLRKNQPFIWVNCAGIPKELIDSELFGYKQGAFTGAAAKGKAGKIELADKGTLFLDEIGDLPLSAQAKILRAIETKHVERLGSVSTKRVDFRLIAATNKNLKAMIEKNEFREDLFYRLSTLGLVIPSLSERIDDIPILITYFLERLSRPNVKVSKESEGILKDYSWPGNVRELKNVVERAISLSDSNIIEVESLHWEIAKGPSLRFEGHKKEFRPLTEELEGFEKRILKEAVVSTKGNMAKAARLLDISRSALYEKFNRYKLEKTFDSKKVS